MKLWKWEKKKDGDRVEQLWDREEKMLHYI